MVENRLAASTVGNGAREGRLYSWTEDNKLQSIFHLSTRIVPSAMTVPKPGNLSTDLYSISPLTFLSDMDELLSIRGTSMSFTPWLASSLKDELLPDVSLSAPSIDSTRPALNATLLHVACMCCLFTDSWPTSPDVQQISIALVWTPSQESFLGLLHEWVWQLHNEGTSYF